MKVLENHRVVTSEGVAGSATFDISYKDRAHLMTILRDTLYSDKVLAVLREYSSNAWDSHRMSGKADVPIKVQMPTHMDPVLIIQDFGLGLSHEDVFQVYTQYGASTKRDNDDAVGMLGIGSKSGFAYSDSFTIVSCHGGMRRTYVAVLDESEMGVINLLGEEPCGENETGVSIQIAVKPEDIPEFTSKAKRLFRFFNPRPLINIELGNDMGKNRIQLSEGYVCDPVEYQPGEWFAVMGCVPYKLDLNQLRGLDGASLVPPRLIQKSGVLYFNIGEVQVNASREELKYSKFTKEALVSKINRTLGEYVTKTLKEIEESDTTPWQKRLKAKGIASLQLSVPPEFEDLIKSAVSVKVDLMEHFNLRYPDGRDVQTIQINNQATLIRRDDNRRLDNFRLDAFSYMVSPKGEATWEEVEKNLDELCEAMKITGIYRRNLSSYTYYPSRSDNAVGKVYNPNHRKRSFRYAKPEVHLKPPSRNWEGVNRVPTEDDVYVVLNRFEVVGSRYWYDLYRKDEAVAKALGLPFPEVYGYKETDDKPVDRDSLVGTPYSQWRETWLNSLVNTPGIRENFELAEWGSAVSTLAHVSPNHHNYKSVSKALGPKHPITRFLRNHMEGRKKSKKISREYDEVLDILKARKAFGESECSKARKEIFAKYPLLSIGGSGISEAWRHNSEHWLQYIRLIDNS